jgi:hypothetical protein
MAAGCRPRNERRCPDRARRPKTLERHALRRGAVVGAAGARPEELQTGYARFKETTHATVAACAPSRSGEHTMRGRAAAWALVAYATATGKYPQGASKSSASAVVLERRDTARSLGRAGPRLRWQLAQSGQSGQCHRPTYRVARRHPQAARHSPRSPHRPARSRPARRGSGRARCGAAADHPGVAGPAHARPRPCEPWGEPEGRHARTSLRHRVLHARTAQTAACAALTTASPPPPHGPAPPPPFPRLAPPRRRPPRPRRHAAGHRRPGGRLLRRQLRRGLQDLGGRLARRQRRRQLGGPVLAVQRDARRQDVHCGHRHHGRPNGLPLP